MESCEGFTRGERYSVMESKQAIELLKEIKLNLIYSETTDAIDKAINALKNEGCGCNLCLAHNNMKCPKT